MEEPTHLACIVHFLSWDVSIRWAACLVGTYVSYWIPPELLSQQDGEGERGGR